jgi:hypothetical protein
MPGDHIAIDFESFYSPQVSVKKMGVREYLDNPETEIYLVSANNGDGIDLACHPHEFNWELLHGRLVVSHNANFDAQVFNHLQHQGVISKYIHPIEWNCTANLCAYLGVPRALDGAAQVLFGASVTKDVRNGMRGKHWADLKPKHKEALFVYSRQDAYWAYRIWDAHADKWPFVERQLSLLTLSSCAYGIALDKGLLHQQLDILELQKKEALKHIPWYPDKPPLSRPAFDAVCETEGLTPPASVAMSSEECDAWMELHGDKYPWVGAMRDYRRANMLSAKIMRMLNRLRPQTGRMPYELKYFGAHTGRDSGSGKINMQNFSREPICGIELRQTIIAPANKKLVIADLKQIEARVLLHLVQDKTQLRLIAKGMSPYEAHARTSMGWKGTGDYKTENPRHYLLAKARVLALGYGAGWRKFNSMAYLPAYLGKEAREIFATPVSEEQVAGFIDYFSKYEKDPATLSKWKKRTPELITEWTNAWLIVQDFRSKNSKIVAFWKLLDQGIRSAEGDDYKIPLPSGRVLKYREVKVSEEHGVTAIICRQGKMVRQKLYGGMLTENVVSAIARDVLRDAALRLSAYGFKIILRVHDELVMEVPRETPLFLIKELMAKCPPWLIGCPIDSSVEEAERYKK